MHTQYGPGDEATWPAFSGHPLDPRFDDDAYELEAQLAYEAASAEIDSADLGEILADADLLALLRQTYTSPNEIGRKVLALFDAEVTRRAEKRLGQ